MNKRQLFIIWCGLPIAVSMIWFPGSWYGYIVNGYPVIKPESKEFLVKILMPLLGITMLLVYGMRDKPMPASGFDGVRKRAREAVGYGEEAAREHVTELSTLSGTSEQWAMFRERHRRRDLSSIPVQGVRLENASWVDDRIVQRRLHVETGAPLDNEKLVRQLKELYALDYFGIIRDDLVVDGGKGTLTVTTPRKPYSRNSLQFGVSLESDVQTAATYSVTVRHMLVAANRRGGEWVNVLQLGNHIVMSSQFYQPLDWSMRWFAAPAISYGRGNQKLWADGQPVAEYGVRNRDARLEMG